MRGLCFTFGLLTAQPRACAVYVLPSVYFFLVLSVTRRRPPLGEVLIGTLNHATCHVHSPKAFETSTHENVTHIVFFFVCEIYFLLVLSKLSIQSKRTCQNAQGYCVIGREITTVLKIAVGSVTPESCDSRDYFASSLLVKKTE